MKILQICPKSPYPAVDGGCIAMNNITRGLLNEGHLVKVLAMDTFKFPAQLALKNKKYLHETHFESQFVDVAIKPLHVLANLCSKWPYNIQRYFHAAFEKKIIQTLKQDNFDCVLVESLYLASYLDVIRRCSSAKIIYREHNIEHHIWQGTRKLTKNKFKKAYYGDLIRKLRNYETGIVDRFDAIAAITDEDAKTMRSWECRAPIETIPFGIDVEMVKSEEKTEYPSLFHLGAMNWLPNQDAIRFFLDEIWPSIRTKHPELKFYLAGREMPEWLLNLDRSNINVVGEVENAYDFMQSKSTMIVPLLSGSGMRIKIIEGMALGKTIISTRLGAQGISCSHTKNILIADTSEEFINWIDACVTKRSFSDKIGMNAKALVKQNYDNNIIARKLADFCVCL